MDEPNKALGAAIAQLRKSSGITQAQVFEATGIDQGGLSRVENGKQALPSDKLASLAKLLGVSPSGIWALAEASGGASTSQRAMPATTRAAKPAVSKHDLDAIRFALASLVGAVVSAKPALAAKLAEGFRSAPDQYLGKDGLLLALAEVAERSAKKSRAR